MSYAASSTTIPKVFPSRRVPLPSGRGRFSISAKASRTRLQTRKHLNKPPRYNRAISYSSRLRYMHGTNEGQVINHAPRGYRAFALLRMPAEIRICCPWHMAAQTLPRFERSRTKSTMRAFKQSFSGANPPGIRTPSKSFESTCSIVASAYSFSKSSPV